MLQGKGKWFLISHLLLIGAPVLVWGQEEIESIKKNLTPLVDNRSSDHVSPFESIELFGNYPSTEIRVANGIYEEPHPFEWIGYSFAPPTELPATNPQTELPLLLTPPKSGTRPSVLPTDLEKSPSAPNTPSRYNPSLVYLPDTNPGVRQPPCPCLPLGRSWLTLSYFLGTTQNDPAPPLLTLGGNGLLNDPATRIIAGNQRLDHDFRSGLRLDGGIWLDKCQNWGIDAHLFLIQSSQLNWDFASNGTNLFGRPYQSTSGGNATQLIAGPGIGSALVDISSPLNFLSGDVNLRRNLTCEDNYRLDFIIGYRYFRMTEGLAIDIAQIPDNMPGTLLQTNDRFQTKNLFYGGQIGLLGEYRWERFYIDGGGKIAFGANWETIQINGGNRMISGTTATPYASQGFLAQASNIGTRHQMAYAVVPEANFTVGYQLTDFCRAFVGYSFLYVSNAVRPAQAIDSVVSSPSGNSGIGGRPAPNNASSEFWIQGVNTGLEFRY